MLIKVFICLIISYLQIKSYNVLNYNNCSTDWPFPLIFFLETAKPNALTILRYQVLRLFCSACIYSICLYKTHMDQRLPHPDQTQGIM